MSPLPPAVLVSNGAVSPRAPPSAAAFLDSTPGAYTTARGTLLWWPRHLRRLAESATLLAHSHPHLLGLPGSRGLDSLAIPLQSQPASGGASHQHSAWAEIIANDSIARTLLRPDLTLGSSIPISPRRHSARRWEAPPPSLPPARLRSVRFLFSLTEESSMALSRRFLNLIVDSRTPGAKSLRCIDLASKHFYDKAPAEPGLADDTGNRKNKKAAEAALKMERIQLPNPIFNFVAARSDLNEPWKIDCFPFADRRVICADQWGRSFLFEADRCRVVTMPRLHQPKVMPISLFIPCPDVDDRDGSTGGNLFIMERVTKPGFCNQFEAFIYCHPERNRYTKSWDCQLLPPPPYICDATYLGMCPKITSYAVLGDGIHICISVEGIGTYRLDTRSRTWSEVGKWNLPVYGKVEYVPELKLWFGLSGEAQDLAAVDLSSMDSQPQLVGTCKEFYPPEEWKQCKDSQLVSLGSGKFCIARFFHTMDSGDELIEQNITVLTCVEVVRVHDGNGNDSTGKVELQMIPYKSRCYISTGDDTIQTVF